MKSERLGCLLKSWEFLARKYKMSEKERQFFFRGIRHLMKGVEKNEKGGSAGQIILDLDDYLSQGNRLQ